MNAPSMTRRRCHALLVSGCGSGQGKTTVTGALALHARALGKRVRVFKTGPDFLDPMVLQAITGEPVWQLDLFMGGEAHCAQLLWEAANEADLVLVEGAMGLFDGNPSSADLAERFGLPVLAVINGAAMAQTLGAIAYGLKQYRPGLPFAGVFANRVASAYHARLLFDSLPPDIDALGWLPAAAELSLPARHLGLVPQADDNDVASRFTAAAKALQPCSRDACQAPMVTFKPGDLVPPPPMLAGQRIAVARDAAFCFLYPANLDCLRAMGASLQFFSPVSGERLPPCDAVWLPGGYPELHAAAWSANEALRADLREHQVAGKPMLAECGGMMSLFDELVDIDEHAHPGFGLLPGRTHMHQRLVSLGLQRLVLPEGELRGHSFHYSISETPLAPIARATNPNGGPTEEAAYRVHRTTASYVHLYFPSNPVAVARLFSSN
ncbi:MAG TPA: cobyrinate a,c-diamide synthase [Burkholderiaceae bacterium]|nr:cobyrinate a,c-diamide synthase [Burkholderiaceae bacterium]